MVGSEDVCMTGSEDGDIFYSHSHIPHLTTPHHTPHNVNHFHNLFCLRPIIQANYLQIVAVTH